MSIDKHLKIAGAIQVAQGIIGLPWCMVVVMLFNRDLHRPIDGVCAQSDGIIFWLPALAFMIGSILCVFQIWFGRSLAKQKRWATRVAGFIWCFVGLFAFPSGTVINGYTLWILVQIDKMETIKAEPATSGAGIPPP